MSTPGKWSAFGLLAVALALLVRVHLRSEASGGAQNSEAAAQLRHWRSTLFRRTIELQTATEQRLGLQTDPEGHAQFSLFEPFVTCPGGGSLERFGGGSDGGKLLCPSLLGEGCVVYSLGSAGDDSFEADILNRTACTVVTFDCTVPGSSTHSRHRYVQKCLGSRERMQAEPGSWVTLDTAMMGLGHAALALLKVDIEGSEYDVFASWELNTANLPQQISMEVHTDWLYHGTPSMRKPTDFSNLFWPMHKVSLSELALFMGHLANLGYAIVSHEPNPLCQHCSELTLLKVA